MVTEETAVKLVRWGLGFGLLVLHAVTDVNGALIAGAMFLLGAPVELIRQQSQ